MILSQLPIISPLCGMRLPLATFGFVLMGSLAACSKTEPPVDQLAAPAQVADAQSAPPNKPTQKPSSAKNDSLEKFKTIEWTDLLPKDDLDALLSPPEYLDEIEDGTEDDQLSSQTKNTLGEGSDDRYQQALASKRIIPEYNNQKIRIPGFIVPLEFDDELTVTQFFLVPYFGACIHLPPPPPNQVIHVTFAEGLTVQELYDPFWVSGTLQTSIVENDTATAAYTLQAVSIDPYVE